MSEKYLRQYIKENILLESKRIDETLGHLAAAVSSRTGTGKGNSSNSRRNSGSSRRSSNSSRSFKTSAYVDFDRPADTSSQLTPHELVNLRVKRSKNALSHVDWKYCRHVTDNWPDYMDWKEWLFHHFEEAPGNTIKIIKKVGNEYIIDPDMIGEPKDGKFEQSFIDKLEKKYEESKKIAFEKVRAAKHRGY